MGRGPPEHVAKRLQREKEVKIAKKATVARQAQRSKALHTEALRRGAKVARTLRGIDAKELSKKRHAEAFGNYYVPPEPKVAFVFRLRGICDMPPKEKKILQLLRLRQIHNGIFIRLTKATIQMLNKVNPFIVWGYPSVPTIRKLLLKRGFGKINGQRIKLTDNKYIKANLGKHGIVCLDDIVFQLATAGPKFRECSRFLWPFKLSTPRGGYEAKRKHFVEGGDYGNRMEYINKVLTRML
eukprot:NODE_2286_length_1157_cov_284.371841_g1895_i0.p2 GENE.NODE_2286_length_1157_cov_284.371841_g1895_i0~~NODE_2286_length_1157_cov_284.371841_g1895_i0.p2  ORF type:complete len:240 (+),score=111.24 NODE_2286_length_1157_cov_284.371841_g1895_i0:146-865(+)